MALLCLSPLGCIFGSQGAHLLLHLLQFVNLGKYLVGLPDYLIVNFEASNRTNHYSHKTTYAYTDHV